MRATRKDELARRLKSLEDAAKNLTDIDAQLSQVRIKSKTVEDLEEFDRQIAALDAQLSAAAATLVVEVKPAGAGKVRIGSLRAKDGHAAPVLTPTKVTVGDLAKKQSPAISIPGLACSEAKSDISRPHSPRSTSP